MEVTQCCRAFPSYYESEKNLKFAEKFKIKRLLSFSDSYLEGTYQNSQRLFRIQFLKAILTFNLLLSILFYVAELHRFGWAGPICLIWIILNLLLLCVALALINILRRNFPPQIGLILTQVYVTLSWVEVFRATQRTWTESYILLLGLILELFMLSAAISKCNWVVCTFFSALLNIYIGVRGTPDREGSNYLWELAFCAFLMNALFISLLAFLKEKCSREAFHKQKIMEQTQRQFEDLIRETIPSAIVIVRQGKIVFYNEESSKLFSAKSKAELEESFRSITIEEKASPAGKAHADGKSFYEKVNVKSEGEAFSLYELITLNKIDPREFPKFSSYAGILNHNIFSKIENKDALACNFEIKLGSLLWEGEQAMMILINEDQTVEKMKLLTSQAEYKDDLLTSVSHDLRSPLNSIIGIQASILEKTECKEVRKSLQIAQRSAKLLLFMINDILDFSQFAHGKLRVRPAAFNVVEEVREVSKLIKFQAKSKGLDFEFISHFKPPGSPLMYNDPNRLKQIILNLLSNALKFTEKGGITITVQPLQEGSGDFCSAQIAVQDTGCGIKEEDLPKLFSKFGKLDDPKKLNSQGVGLGLEISQTLVRSLNLFLPGDEIKVSSVLGKGSLFSFNLRSMPFEDADKKLKKNLVASQLFKELSQIDIDLSEFEFEVRGNPLPPFSSKSNSPNLHAKGHPAQIRILLAEDDQINIMVLKMYLSQCPEFVYDLAFNGKQAVEIVLENSAKGTYYDLILMDCNMPIMDGYEAAQKIKKIEEERVIPNVYIVALTADSSERDLRRCLSIGMVDHWTKPLEKLDFLSKLNKYRDQLYENRMRNLLLK